MNVWFSVLCYDIECPHATVTGERASPDTSQCDEELTLFASYKNPSYKTIEVEIGEIFCTCLRDTQREILL